MIEYSRVTQKNVFFCVNITYVCMISSSVYLFCLPKNDIIMHNFT